MPTGDRRQPDLVKSATSKFIGEVEHFDVFTRPAFLELTESMSKLRREVSSK